MMWITEAVLFFGKNSAISFARGAHAQCAFTLENAQMKGRSRGMIDNVLNTAAVLAITKS